MRRLLVLVAVAVVATIAAAAYAVTRPDPAAQAQADGCVRSTTAIVKQEAPNWVYVDDRAAPAGGPNPPAQWVSGIVNSSISALAVHPTGVDDPFTHSSYDFNVNVLPDAETVGLLAGTPSAGTGNFAGSDEGFAGEAEEQARLHMEREEATFPAFARPEVGDRIRALGSWVWDCGHWIPGGERTEFHPWRALWVDRAVSPRSPYGEAEGDLLITTAATKAGRQADCAHKTKGNVVEFKSCTAAQPDWQDVNGDYSFFLPAPPKPSPAAKLRIRVLDQGSSAGGPAVSVQPRANGAQVTLKIAAPAGRKLVVAKEIFVGWSPIPAAALPVHLRVALQQLLVRRAMDPGCPNAQKGCGSVESTREDQITTAPGEWLVYWDVGGIWGAWQPTVLLVDDGQVVKGRQTVDLYVPRTKAWRFLTFARECDFGAVNLSPCPKTAEFGNAIGDDDPGVATDRFASPAASAGVHHANARLDAGSSCPPSNKQGCYQVTYGVSVVDDAAKRASARR